MKKYTFNSTVEEAHWLGYLLVQLLDSKPGSYNNDPLHNMANGH